MGRCETASTYVAITFKIKDLLEFVTAENVKAIYEILFSDNTFVVDSNNMYNTVFTELRDAQTDGHFPPTCAGMQQLATRLQTLGDRMLMRHGGEEQTTYDVYDPENDCLYNQTYAFTTYTCNLITVDRWGYSREGTNTECTELSLATINTKTEILKEIFTKFGFHQYTVALLTSIAAG